MKSLFRSIVSSWAGLALTVLLGFIVSPVIVRFLGQEQYGVWALTVSIASQFILLDFGIRNSVMKFISDLPESERTGDACSRIISTGAVIQGSGALVTIFLTLAVLPYIDDWFSIPESIVSPARTVLVLLAVDAALELFFGGVESGLCAEERYDIYNLLQVLRYALTATLSVLVLIGGGDIVGLASVTLLSRLLYREAILLFLRREVPGIRHDWRLVSRDTFKTLVRYGTWASVANVAYRIMYSLDVLVAGALFSPREVALYAVSLILVDQFRMFAQSGSLVLNPRLSSLASSDEVSEVLRGWTRVATLLSGGVALPLIVLGPSFLRLWMGEEYQESGTLLVLLILPFVFVVPGLGLQAYAFARSEHQTVAISFLAEGAMNLILSIALANAFGLKGIALGTLIPAVLFRGVLLPLILLRRVESPGLAFFREAFVKPIPLFIAHVILLGALVALIGVSDWPSFLVVASVSGSIFIFCSYFLYLTEDERRYVRRRLSR